MQKNVRGSFLSVDELCKPSSFCKETVKQQNIEPTRSVTFAKNKQGLRNRNYVPPLEKAADLSRVSFRLRAESAVF